MKYYLILIALLWACWGTIWPESMAYAVLGPNDGLCWDQVTANADGTPITDLAGYRMHYGTSSGVYTAVTDVGLTATPSAPCIDLRQLTLTMATWFFVVTAYDTSGNESGPSNEYTDFFDPELGLAPNSPQNLRKR